MCIYKAPLLHYALPHRNIGYIPTVAAMEVDETENDEDAQSGSLKFI